MTVTAQSPAAKVFGYEVPDDISTNKNLLQQCVVALTANGVPVTLPGGGTFQSPNIAADEDAGLYSAGDPISLEKRLVTNLLTAIAGISQVNASLVLVSSAPANVVTLAALVAGYGGNSITITVAAGTSSGKKITITPPKGSSLPAEVYDNTTDTGTGFVTAIQGVSKIVSATIVPGAGALVPANLSVTNLASGTGVIVTPPGFAPVGENPVNGYTALNDGASQTVDIWGNAIFTALQNNGYIV